jgi:hypothetical protein
MRILDGEIIIGRGRGRLGIRFKNTISKEAQE